MYCPFKYSSIHSWDCEGYRCRMWDETLGDCALVAEQKQQSKEKAERTNQEESWYREQNQRYRSRIELNLTEEP